MSHGTLTLYTGPMFAGKTSALVRDILYQTYFSGPHMSGFFGRFSIPGSQIPGSSVMREPGSMPVR